MGLKQEGQLDIGWMGAAQSQGDSIVNILYCLLSLFIIFSILSACFYLFPISLTRLILLNATHQSLHTPPAMTEERETKEHADSEERET